MSSVSWLWSSLGRGVPGSSWGFIGYYLLPSASQQQCFVSLGLSSYVYASYTSFSVSLFLSSILAFLLLGPSSLSPLHPPFFQTSSLFLWPQSIGVRELGPSYSHTWGSDLLFTGRRQAGLWQFWAFWAIAPSCSLSLLFMAFFFFSSSHLRVFVPSGAPWPYKIGGLECYNTLELEGAAEQFSLVLSSASEARMASGGSGLAQSSQPVLASGCTIARTQACWSLRACGKMQGLCTLV